MDVVLTYGCFLVAGFAAGGTWSAWKARNQLVAGVLLALTVIAAAAGILRVM